MPQIINTNLSSLNAQRNLNNSQRGLTVSLQRLSSGLRINSAKDDAAGLAISNRFTTQVRGLSVAVRNANDGISFAQTAESALSEVTTALQRMRDLAVQSANETNSSSDRLSLQAEMDQLKSEISRIAKTTTFNGINILDGTEHLLSFQIGPNANETVSVEGVDAKTYSLGIQPGLVQSTGNRINVGLGEDDGTIGIQHVGDAPAYSTSIENFSIQLDSIDDSDIINIADTKYGGNLDSSTAADQSDRFSENYGTGQAKAIAQRINEIRESGEESLRDVYASATTTFRGSEITTDDFFRVITVVDSSNAPDTNVGEGSLNAGDITINGVDIPAVVFEENDGDGSLTSAINSQSETTGVTAHVDKNGELVLTADDGRDIIFNFGNKGGSSADNIERSRIMNDLFGGGSNLGSDRFTGVSVISGEYIRITGQITISGTDTINFSGNASDLSELGFDANGLSADIAEDNVKATGTIANADITTIDGANLTIETVDSALSQINEYRAKLGALQNRFESTIRNLSSVSESLSSASSRILDADFALETAGLAKSQVLQQSGISILAQANALPQQIISLLT